LIVGTAIPSRWPDLALGQAGSGSQSNGDWFLNGGL
jgi:hypothetical protein